MANNSMQFTLVESLIPRLKVRSAFKNDRDYVDYVYKAIKGALSINMGRNRDIEGITVMSANVSPTYRIRELYESSEELSDEQIKMIIKHAVNIKKVQSSLCQRGTTADKLNFYMCWSLYEQGLTWMEIYKATDECCAWNTEDPETVIRKLQRMKVRFEWERKPKI